MTYISFQTNAINRHFEETISSIDKEHEKLRRLFLLTIYFIVYSTTVIITIIRATQNTKNAASKNLSGLIQVKNPSFQFKILTTLTLSFLRLFNQHSWCAADLCHLFISFCPLLSWTLHFRLMTANDEAVSTALLCCIVTCTPFSQHGTSVASPCNHNKSIDSMHKKFTSKHFIHASCTWRQNIFRFLRSSKLFICVARGFYLPRSSAAGAYANSCSRAWQKGKFLFTCGRRGYKRR